MSDGGRRTRRGCCARVPLAQGPPGAVLPGRLMNIVLRFYHRLLAEAAAVPF